MVKQTASFVQTALGLAVCRKAVHRKALDSLGGHAHQLQRPEVLAG